MRQIEIEFEGEVFRASLLEDRAPKTCQLIWDLLPLADRTVQVKWSGDAWRTWGDYALPVPTGTELENPGHHLKAGDLVYYPGSKKLCVAYGDAEWLAPHGRPLDVTVYGRIEEGSIARLVDLSMKAWLEGAKEVTFRHAG